MVLYQFRRTRTWEVSDKSSCSDRNHGKSGSTDKWSVFSVVGLNQGVMHAVNLLNNVVETHILSVIARHSYLVLDNASIHNAIDLSRILSARNITVVFLPVYSYDMNPIETVFGYCKTFCKKYPGLLRVDPVTGSLNAFSSVPQNVVRSFTRRVGKLMHKYKVSQGGSCDFISEFA